MTVMLTDLADVARAAGLRVIEVAGWRTRGHGQMADVQTITCHHTGGAPTGNYPSLRVVRDGRADLPGPLAHLGLARDGTVYVIAAGLCWHAGQSRARSYENPHAIGIEAENSGSQPWPGVQMTAYATLCRALIDHYGLPITAVLGHKETCAPPGRKIDPTFDMTAFRRRVASVRLATKTSPEEDDMPTAREVADALLDTKIRVTDAAQGPNGSTSEETVRDILARLVRLTSLTQDAVRKGELSK